MTTEPTRCEHCNGQIVKEHDRLFCLQCGRDAMTRWGRAKWFKAHKEEMIEDLLKMGREKTMAKWRLTPQGLGFLTRDPLYKEKAGVKEPAATAQDNQLPPLPEWRDNWDPEVQVKWLEAWMEARAKFPK